MRLIIKTRFTGDEFRSVSYPKGGGYKSVGDLQKELLRRWKNHPRAVYETCNGGVVWYHRNTDTGKANARVAGYVLLEADEGDRHREGMHYLDHHIWSYCTYLGSTEMEGRGYDLGVYISALDGTVSYAISHGAEPAQYISGEIYGDNGVPYPTQNPVKLLTRELYEQRPASTPSPEEQKELDFLRDLKWRLSAEE